MNTARAGGVTGIPGRGVVMPIGGAEDKVGRMTVLREVVRLAGGPATQRDYFGTVTDALGIEPAWQDEPAWTGQIVADRARRWGWTPRVTLAQALDELRRGLEAAPPTT